MRFLRWLFRRKPKAPPVTVARADQMLKEAYRRGVDEAGIKSWLPSRAATADFWGPRGHERTGAPGGQEVPPEGE